MSTEAPACYLAGMPTPDLSAQRALVAAHELATATRTDWSNAWEQSVVWGRKSLAILAIRTDQRSYELYYGTHQVCEFETKADPSDVVRALAAKLGAVGTLAATSDVVLFIVEVL